MKCTICKEIVESYTVTEDETLCDDCNYDMKKERELEVYTYTKFDAEYDHWKERRHEHGTD